MKSSLPPLRTNQVYPSNPFAVPDDTQILNFSLRRRQQLHQRKQKRALKLWETPISRTGALRWIQEIEMEPQLDKQPITVAQAAHAALVTDRVRNRESVTSTIQKKRQMFLLQMQIDIKKQEIKNLQQFSLLREYGLKNSQEMLVEDMNRFNAYWDDCKRQSHDAMKQAKRLNKQKADLNFEINRLNDDVSHAQNQIQKYEDNLTQYRSYQDFLEATVTTGQTAAEYFVNPQQLVEVFDNLVEQNLTMIQIIQEIEKDLEEYRHELVEIEEQTSKKLSEMNAKKQGLIKEIEEKEKRCSVLEQRLYKDLDSHNATGIMSKLQESIRNVLGNDSDEGQQGCINFLTKIEMKMDFFLMVISELDTEHNKKEKVENMLPEVRYLHEKFSDLQRIRRDQARLISIAIEQKLNDEKQMKYTERSMNVIDKKLGRQANKKTKILEKMAKKEVKKIPQEILDRREFLEEYDQQQ